MSNTSKETFLQSLLTKQAMVEHLGASTGKDVAAARQEVARQIRQCLMGGDLKRGEGVTKSGEED